MELTLNALQYQELTVIMFRGWRGRTDEALAVTQKFCVQVAFHRQVLRAQDMGPVRCGGRAHRWRGVRLLVPG